MKTKFLETLGLEKSAIDSIMAENGRDIEAYKQQIADITGERDGLKSQLEEVGKKLDAFKGVNLDALKKEIDTLKRDIVQKDTDYQKQLAERDFQAVISAEIAAAHGRSQKAIVASLDVEALKKSKNQKEDIVAALKALRESDSYLFDESKTTDSTPAKVSTGGAHDENGGSSPQNNNAQMNALITGRMKGDQ